MSGHGAVSGEDRPPDPVSWVTELPERSGRSPHRGPGSLDSNESVLPPPPAVRTALARVGALSHLYPDGQATSIRQAIAEATGATPDQVLVGHGSEDVLRLLLAAYASAGRVVTLADPPCAVHLRICRLVGARTELVPLRTWTHDLAALAERVADVVLLCNPHNPSGTVVSREQLDAFVAARRARLVVVDEAYLDFASGADRLSALPLARSRADVVVVRTLSKFFGLAGVRLGYLVAHPGIRSVVGRLQEPFPVSALASAAGVAALGDQDHQQQVQQATASLRRRLRTVLVGAGYRPVDSDANFLLVPVDDEDEMLDRLAAGSVTARAGRDLGVPGVVRISVPTEEGLALVAAALGVPVPA